MIKLVWDNGFKRSYKRRISPHPILKERFRDAIERFVEDPYAKELRTRKLTGNLSGCWAFSVDEDRRVLKAKNSVLLIDIGTHEEVY
jgi:mRNA-degrading endonuclease YafQ of YafQ-DinJ toxin-antitoxin module